MQNKEAAWLPWDNSGHTSIQKKKKQSSTSCHQNENCHNGHRASGKNQRVCSSSRVICVVLHLKKAFVQCTEPESVRFDSSSHRSALDLATSFRPNREEIGRTLKKAPSHCCSHGTLLHFSLRSSRLNVHTLRCTIEQICNFSSAELNGHHTDTAVVCS